MKSILSQDHYSLLEVHRFAPKSEIVKAYHRLKAAFPAVIKGDKRVILVDGEPVGAINRVPATGETRSNLHVGGRAEKIALTDRDREICARIGPLLREKGQIFVGIDIIGDYLTEINLTSPTGMQELERFDGVNIAAKVWQAIERRRAVGAKLPSSAPAGS